jgi:alpha-glucosidase
MPPGDPRTAAGYLSGGDKGIHLAFDFSLIFSTWNARKYYQCISKWYSRIPDQAWPCNVLSNHDLFRSINRYTGRQNQEEKARIAAFLLLTLRGTPFIYYGEEIGMKNGKLKKSDILDPLGKKYWPWFKGRDRARTPMQWSGLPHAGFSEGTPWLRANPDFNSTNVANQQYNPNSLLWIYRSLIGLRKKHPALQSGNWIPLLKGKKGVLAYFRETGEETLLIILNFTGRGQLIKVRDLLHGEVLLSTCREKGTTVNINKMKLFPYEATLYKSNLL